MVRMDIGGPIATLTPRIGLVLSEIGWFPGGSVSDAFDFYQLFVHPKWLV